MIDNGYELFNMILSSNCYDCEETILDANEILVNLADRTTFCKQFNEQLEDFAKDTMRCVCCGKELVGVEEECQYIAYRCLNNECNNY